MLAGKRRWCGIQTTAGEQLWWRGGQQSAVRCGRDSVDQASSMLWNGYLDRGEVAMW